MSGRPGITITRMVKADTDTEAAATARTMLPVDHRAEAVLIDAWPEQWLAGRWNVTYDLPSFDVVDAIVPTTHRPHEPS